MKQVTHNAMFALLISTSTFPAGYHIKGQIQARLSGYMLLVELQNGNYMYWKEEGTCV